MQRKKKEKVTSLFRVEFFRNLINEIIGRFLERSDIQFPIHNKIFGARGRESLLFGGGVIKGALQPRPILKKRRFEKIRKFLARNFGKWKMKNWGQQRFRVRIENCVQCTFCVRWRRKSKNSTCVKCFDEIANVRRVPITEVVRHAKKCKGVKKLKGEKNKSRD